MTEIAIIGGSGLANLKNLEIVRREVIRTPYGEPSAPVVIGKLHGVEVLFLPRHGPGHTIPPHKVNYRANIWALKETGISKVVAVAAVGSITGLAPGKLMVTDQIIDYTYGREHTYTIGNGGIGTHVDFTQPYCQKLRQVFIEAAKASNIEIAEKGTYGATQGPRFESAAEISRLERDGVDVVGMTGMPEAGLARELGLCYATIAVCANPAAGKGGGSIDIKQVEETLNKGMENVRKLLENVIPLASKI